MKTKHIYWGAMLLFIIATICCKKPYTPTIVSTDNHYLVVEGIINSGSDSTFITLSRTVKLSDNVNHTAELGARVTVESDQGGIYPLSELGKGTYASAGLNLDNSHKYHLHIITSDNKEYKSDDEAVKVTPPIDSVGYTIQSGGIQLYVNTHDPNNNTRYYRWDYQETWNFHAKYSSGLMSDGTKLVPRPVDKQIYTCWATDTSSTILLGSTKALVKDVVYQNPLTQITSTSEKLETKYSILIKQYALSSDAYKFWQSLKTNNEQLGTIFSVLPSELPGNIHCVTTPAEPVIGYISVGTVQQKRMFISEDQLPQNWYPVYPYECSLDSLLFCHGGTPCQNDVALFLIPLGSTEYAVFPITDKEDISVLGYVAADAQCADCTIRGVNKPPPFWK
ncbi:MAG TPA: DUF4249 domain-containing protein [Mucilaginibacter sp.]